MSNAWEVINQEMLDVLSNSEMTMEDILNVPVYALAHEFKVQKQHIAELKRQLAEAQDELNLRKGIKLYHYREGYYICNCCGFPKIRGHTRSCVVPKIENFDAAIERENK